MIKNKILMRAQFKLNKRIFRTVIIVIGGVIVKNKVSVLFCNFGNFHKVVKKSTQYLKKPGQAKTIY